MLTTEQSFKAGFIAACVEQGLSLPQAHSAVKRASALLEKKAIINSLTNIVKPLLSGAMNVGVPLALAAPPIIGGTAGFAAAKLTDVDDTDIQEVKKQEIIDSLKRQAAKLQRAVEIRNYKAAR